MGIFYIDMDTVTTQVFIFTFFSFILLAQHLFALNISSIKDLMGIWGLMSFGSYSF